MIINMIKIVINILNTMMMIIIITTKYHHEPCWAFEKYKFGKQSRWQYRLPIIVPSSVQPLHSHLPRKKVIVLMRMIMMIMVMMMVVSLLIMILIRGWQCALCKAVSDSFNLGSKFLPGFLQISVKDFCIARFHFCLLQFVHRAI